MKENYWWRFLYFKDWNIHNLVSELGIKANKSFLSLMILGFLGLMVVRDHTKF